MILQEGMLYTCEEVALHLKCHVNKVRRLAREQKLRSIPEGNRYLFKKSHIDAYLEPKEISVKVA